MAAAGVGVGVGVGVFVRSPDHPGCVLLGQRIAKHADGAGTFALPGGHLERYESWAECAAREVLEETGLVVSSVRQGTVINCTLEPSSYHYIVVFMVADVPAGATFANLEPDKCAGWSWHAWSSPLPTPTFQTLAEVRALGFNPFCEASLGGLLQDAHGTLPPYCCCILIERSSGALLLEQRGADAKVAANSLTCFGGKRDVGESPVDCVLRELQEELGVEITTTSSSLGIDVQGLRRAVDLYVDGKLIAWFFAAVAPARDAPLVYEEGRTGVWLGGPSDRPYIEAQVSPWHACVLAAWRRGKRRADFLSAQR